MGIRIEKVLSIDFDIVRNKATFIIPGGPIRYETAHSIGVESPAVVAWHDRPSPTIIFDHLVTCEETYLGGKPAFVCKEEGSASGRSSRPLTPGKEFEILAGKVDASVVYIPETDIVKVFFGPDWVLSVQDIKKFGAVERGWLSGAVQKALMPYKKEWPIK